MLFVLIFMLLWGISMCSEYWSDKGRFYRIRQQKMLYIFRVIINWVYTETKVEPRQPPPQKNKKEDVEDEDEWFVVEVHGRGIHPSAVFFMVLHVVSLVGCAVLTLWNTAMIEESSVCDQNYDCFTVESTKKYQAGTALGDCSEFGNETSVSENGIVYYLECYRFVMNYAGGLGAAGGILYFSIVITNVYLTGVFLVYRMGSEKGKNKHYVICCRYFVAIAAMLGVTISLLTLIIFLIVYEPVSSLIFRTFRDGLLFGVYSLDIILCLFTVPFIAFGSLAKENKDPPTNNVSPIKNDHPMKNDPLVENESHMENESHTENDSHTKNDSYRETQV